MVSVSLEIAEDWRNAISILTEQEAKETLDASIIAADCTKMEFTKELVENEDGSMRAAFSMGFALGVDRSPVDVSTDVAVMWRNMITSLSGEQAQEMLERSILKAGATGMRMDKDVKGGPEHYWTVLTIRFL